MIGTIGVVAITLVAVTVVGFGFGFLWNKFLKNKDVTPYLDWIMLMATFVLEQFDFLEKGLVLTVLDYVQEAYRIAEEASGLETIEAKTNFIIDKTYELCEKNGISIDQTPALKSLIEQGAVLFISYMSKADIAMIASIPMKQLNI